MKNLFTHKIWIGTVFILLSAVIIYGCDDFLNAPPQGSLDEQALQSPDGLEKALISAYRALDWNEGSGGDWGHTASNWVWGSVLSDDAYKGSEATDQPNVTDLELYNWTTGQADSYLNDAWRGAYDGINRANSVIRVLDGILEESPDDITDENAESIRGEALFLRAHYHFKAWKLWENIPYYTEEDLDYRKSNEGVDVIGNILADLDDAIELLPPEERNGEPGRVTSWAAKAYKGKVQVFSEDFPGAITTLSDVRNNGPYELEENFHQVWTGFQEYANGSETILAYQASVRDGDPNAANSNYGNRLNFPHSGSPLACCGFHQPTQNLVNFFVVGGNGLPVAMDNPSQVFDSNAGWNSRDDELDNSATEAVDPRLDWTVGRDGVPYKDWGEHEAGWIRQQSFGGPYSPKKHVHEEAADAQANVGWQPEQQNSVNTHILRYADVLLLLAEAEVEAGDPEIAREIVNEIRTRASVVAQGPGDDAGTIAVPIDDVSIDWANYSIGTYDDVWNDQEFARQAVRTERRLELAMEGHRFFDLRRWGLAVEVLNPYIEVEQNRRSFLSNAAEFTERYNLFPLPTVQIELSEVDGEQRVVQNDGW